MNRNQVIRIIADHRETLARDFGVKSLALFGSVVRNEANPTSDVDLLVEFDDRPIGLFHLSRTQHYLEKILGVGRVDLVLREGIKPALKERILREAIDAA
jgi:predicted nucleotidyltransferase